jgi:hypothetical protein
MARTSSIPLTSNVITCKNMDKINLQIKTKALQGKIESYWFENKNIGLKNTLFHRVTIPLEAFDSDLDYERKPLKTEIVFEWYKLNLSDPLKLDALNLSHEIYPNAEASIYVGWAHNWCNIKTLMFKLINDNLYDISGEIIVAFENEGIGQNETFAFKTSAIYTTA